MPSVSSICRGIKSNICKLQRWRLQSGHGFTRCVQFLEVHQPWYYSVSSEGNTGFQKKAAWTTNNKGNIVWEMHLCMWPWQYSLLQQSSNHTVQHMNNWISCTQVCSAVLVCTKTPQSFSPVSWAFTRPFCLKMKGASGMQWFRMSFLQSFTPPFLNMWCLEQTI
jgi:hypothetical protein